MADRLFLCRIMAVIAVSSACLTIAPIDAFGAYVTISAKPIETFQKDGDETRFGALSYVGGFSFSAFGSGVAGISGLVVDTDGEGFTAITDIGDWVTGRIARDASGAPTGLKDVEVEPLTGTDGSALEGKIESDAEGLARRGDNLLVSFERRPRILSYPVVNKRIVTPAEVPQPIPLYELRANEGLEALAVAPPGSSLSGALITFAEGSIDTNGNLFAAIVDGPQSGIFKIRKDERWDVTDADFLPDGDLLVLERRYDGFTSGLGARIRRVAGNRISPGALVDGDIIFEADLSEEIDNMEGLAIWQDDAGRTRLILISDNNNSFLQRNLLLEFVLENKEAGL
ncbi:esterase-like activity of phytase family protein [Fulvimarina sp. MAC8]|uniref:esterase-like activity of phytase family protein n=1 Tax=Fulvimarina sp. MAC8 TaxID=3162874 RepID=UPI0032EAB360